MANTILGSAVSFAFEGTANGLTETTTTVLTGKFILQSADTEQAADEEQVRNASGAVVNRSFYNTHKKASLEYTATGATLATARTNSASPVIGTIINISACADMPDLVASNWIVVSSKVSGSNTSAKRVSLGLEAHAGVTAAAT